MRYSVPYEVRSAWFHHEPVDGSGGATTKFSRSLLRHFFDHSSKFLHVDDVAAHIYAHP